MARLNERKPDAYRARLTVPLAEQTLERLKELAGRRGQTPTCAVRELIEHAVRQEAAGA